MIFTHQINFLIVITDGAEVAPPLHTISVTHTCTNAIIIIIIITRSIKALPNFLPVLALKYDESASSLEMERPMSTEGSHSSPRCSWVGEQGGGGGRRKGEGNSEGREGLYLPMTCTDDVTPVVLQLMFYLQVVPTGQGGPGELYQALLHLLRHSLKDNQSLEPERGSRPQIPAGF